MKHPIRDAAEGVHQAALNLAQTNTNKNVESRVVAVENAIIQINHFTEAIEKLDLTAWKADVTADLRWIKLLMGATVIAAIGQLVITFLRGG